MNMHFKEDTSKPENRVNITLFHLLMIQEIETFIKSKLGLPVGALIYPSSNLIIEDITSPDRPDYVVVCGKKEIGYIEVELGIEDKEQLDRFRTKQNLPVYSIVGKKNYNEGDLTLEEIHQYIQGIKSPFVNSQKGKSIELFERLVEHYIIDGKFNENKRAPISDAIRKSAIIQGLFDYFGSDKIIENSKPMRGKLLLDTISDSGFSIRVYSDKARRSSLALMSRSKGADILQFPSGEKLNKYLPKKLEVNLSYCNLISNLGDDGIFTLEENKKATLRIKTVEEHLPEFFQIIEKLM